MILDDLMFKPRLMKGQRILVTGGGTGLGKVMAEALLMLGAEVYIWGRRGGVLQEAADELMAAHGGKVVAQPCDIRVPEAISDTLDEIWSDGGALTGLVNNAAGNFISRTEDLSPRGFDAITNIVFRGSFFVTLDCGKRWIAEKKAGSVVSILTTWVWNGGPFTVPSAMSKAGLHIMTQSLAVEWGPKNIRLNAIAPGAFPTRHDRQAQSRRKPRRGCKRRLQPWQSHGPGRQDARVVQSGRPAARTGRRLYQRPDHRHRRRRPSGRRRRVHRPAKLVRRTVGRSPQRHSRRQ
jgi:NAD(P)-dependent dehydrogenase (short-subunit alcohol dehydrogenase family)